jgi:hypothetical protein
LNTTTTLVLRDAFAAAIRGIDPTAEQLRDIRWSYTPSARAGGRAQLQPATRNFDLLFRDPGPSFEWVGGRGTAYKTILAVCTSYAGIEPELRDHIKAQDGIDLRRALRRLISPAIDGLCDVRATGEANEAETESSHYVEHRFEVHFHQATA